MGNSHIRITPLCMSMTCRLRFGSSKMFWGSRRGIDTPGYAYVQREVAAVRIMKASRSPGEEVPPGNRRFMYRHRCGEDLGAVLTELKLKFRHAAARARVRAERSGVWAAGTDDRGAGWQPAYCVWAVDLRDAKVSGGGGRQDGGAGFLQKLRVVVVRRLAAIRMKLSEKLLVLVVILLGVAYALVRNPVRFHQRVWLGAVTMQVPVLWTPVKNPDGGGCWWRCGERSGPGSGTVDVMDRTMFGDGFRG